jgi:hypothetical protein
MENKHKEQCIFSKDQKEFDLPNQIIEAIKKEDVVIFGFRPPHRK